MKAHGVGLSACLLATLANMADAGARPPVAASAAVANELGGLPEAVTAPRSWVEGGPWGRAFVDVSRIPARAWPGDAIASIEVPPVSFRGALYDHLVLGPEPGVGRLTWGERDPFADGPSLVIAPLSIPLEAREGSLIQVRQDGEAIAIRWSGFVDAFQERATFDAFIEPGASGQADVTYQYLLVPHSARGAREAVRLADTSRPEAQALPVAEGLQVLPGGVVVFPGDLPWHPPVSPMTGCGIAPSWCIVVDAFDPGCRPGTLGAPLSTCADTVSKLWNFNEGAYCRTCPYTFYVAVECGTEMHLPFRDMEGNQIQITDVFTGVELQLDAQNECTWAPFEYCDNCNAVPPRGVPYPVSPLFGPCDPPLPRAPCIPYQQTSTKIQWGWPLQDLDGDTVFDELPCGPPNQDQCNGYQSGAYMAYQETNVDVVLRGDPALCGVFRIDIASGGYRWFLSANCTGIVPRTDQPAEIALNFNVYLNCADALAAFDPVPELAITNLDFTGVCPDISVVVEITNLGCADSLLSPVHLDFADPLMTDIDIDLGVVPAGTSTAVTVPVTLTMAPQGVTATIDPAGLIAECTEQAPLSFSGCRPASGADSLTTTLCLCTNTVVAQAAQTNVLTCNSIAATLDASPSSALPCAGGVTEYRFLDAAGGIVQDWSTTATMTVVPATCPSIEMFHAEARCSLETAIDCVDTIDIQLECRLGQEVTVATSASPICQGESVTLTASSGSFLSYTWSNGRAGRTIDDRPSADTTYEVTAIDSAGCVSRASVTVQVLPDPIPGPLGTYLRVRKESPDVVFNLRPLPTLVGVYELVCHEPVGTGPCTAAEPPNDPTPIVIDVAGVIDSMPPGSPAWTLRHVDGLNTCPRLIFYKVRATSPCTGTRGPTCDGFPFQLLPCP